MRLEGVLRDLGTTEGSNPLPTDIILSSGSHVAVLGGGPAGAFFAYFLLDMASRVGLGVDVDIYERRDFSIPGPTGCNMCGGIISESLIQTLAIEGINLPPSVVERSIDSYVLHTDEGSVRIDTPLHEKRIASVHRGSGPKNAGGKKWESFDAYLLNLALAKGARLIRGKVEDVALVDGKPRLGINAGTFRIYDLLAVAAGVNTSALNLFERLRTRYDPPKTVRTYISEFYLGEDLIQRHLGSSMHVFLLNLPMLEFAAIIPKGEFGLVCLLGEDIDEALVRSFLDHHVVKSCFPAGWQPKAKCCHCSPRMNIRGSVRPYADRIVFIGDSGVSRLFKDGIGSAYRTAKAAATTAIFQGVSSRSFNRHYAPLCNGIRQDNRIGKIIFMGTREIQRRNFDRRGVLRMVSKEQSEGRTHRPMSTVLWDIFTGSASYREVFLRTLQPAFIGRFLWEILAGMISFRDVVRQQESEHEYGGAPLSSRNK